MLLVSLLWVSLLTATVFAGSSSENPKPPKPDSSSQMEHQLSGLFLGTDFKAEEGWFLVRIRFRDCGRSLMDVRIAMSHVPYNTTCDMEEYRLMDPDPDLANAALAGAQLPPDHYLKDLAMINVPHGRGCMANRIRLNEFAGLSLVAEIDRTVPTPLPHMLHVAKIYALLKGAGKNKTYNSRIVLVPNHEARRTLEDIKQHFPDVKSSRPPNPPRQPLKTMNKESFAQGKDKKSFSGSVIVDSSEDL